MHNPTQICQTNCNIFDNSIQISTKPQLNAQLIPYFHSFLHSLLKKAKFSLTFPIRLPIDNTRTLYLTFSPQKPSK